MIFISFNKTNIMNKLIIDFFELSADIFIRRELIDTILDLLLSDDRDGLTEGKISISRGVIKRFKNAILCFFR
jgi:hypothetical protein